MKLELINSDEAPQDPFLGELYSVSKIHMKSVKIELKSHLV